MRFFHYRGWIVGGALGTLVAGGGLAQEPAPDLAPLDTRRVPAGATHVVVEGDTLWGIAERYYRDPYAWPRLWSYNPDLTNPHYIYPGDVLNLGPGETGAAGAQAASFVGQGGAPASRRPVSQHAPSAVLLREQAYLDAEALQQSGTVIGSSETHMMLTAADELYVRFDEAPRAPVGREFSVYRHVHEAENSPLAANVYHYDPSQPGAIVRILGTLRVVEYDAESRTARAEIVEALDVIERGFRVADVPQRFVHVPPKTNERTVESTVVAAMRPVELIGQNQVVYLGVGSNDGVVPGNRFFVVRRQDGWRHDLPKRDEAAMGADRPAEPLPDESNFPVDIAGELMVLYTRPASATAIVTHAVREIAPGDRVRMPDGY